MKQDQNRHHVLIFGSHTLELVKKAAFDLQTCFLYQPKKQEYVMFKLLGFPQCPFHTPSLLGSVTPRGHQSVRSRLGCSKILSVSRVKSAHAPKTTRIRRDHENFYHRMRSRSWRGSSRSQDGPGWKVTSYSLVMLSEHQQNSEAHAVKPIETSPLIAVGKVELQTFTLFSFYFFEYFPPQNLKFQECVEHIKYQYNSIY